jgi:8-oxo-dGTP pyrophosphatase MutT (NUDIX family)
MNERQVFSFLVGKRRFNYRVAAVIIRDGHVLVCREDKEDFVMLPGGRIEHGEASDVSLSREIEEELKCTGEIGRLLFAVEDFFKREGEQFHEIGKYYLVELPEDFPFILEGPTLSTFDEGHELTFYWLPIAGDALARLNLLPEWIRDRFMDLPETPQHLIEDER